VERGFVSFVALLHLCSHGPPPGDAAPPNIIVIMTDDQRWDSIEFLPSLRQLAEEGVDFQQSFVTTPVCYLSRASFLTGRLASDLGLENTTQFDTSGTIAVRLQERGYVTAHFGKYLNDYWKRGAPAVPPGWDEWRVFRDRFGDTFGLDSLYKNTILSWNGKFVYQGGYSTDFLTDFTLEFIEEHASQPFFVYLSYYAAHVPLKPDERHLGTLAGVAPERPPSHGKRDRSDKPRFLREVVDHSTPEGLQTSWDLAWQLYLETLLAVDENVGRIVDRLRALDLDRKTVVIFTSDNGFSMGEHGWLGKGVPYEESIRVPLIVWAPGFAEPRAAQEMVMNLDVTATIADLAGVEMETDGRSFVPLLKSRAESWRWWTRVIPIDYIWYGLHNYRGFRTRSFKAVTWEDGFVETYDLRRDPYELENRSAP